MIITLYMYLKLDLILLVFKLVLNKMLSYWLGQTIQDENRRQNKQAFKLYAFFYTKRPVRGKGRTHWFARNELISTIQQSLFTANVSH